MAALHLHLEYRDSERDFVLSREEIVLGKADGCSMRIPLAWLQDEHLIIQNGEMPRVRLFDASSHATLNGRELRTDWALLPPKSQIVLSNGKGDSLKVDLEITGASLVSVGNKRPAKPLPEAILRPEIVSSKFAGDPSADDDDTSYEGSPRDHVPAPAVSPPTIDPKVKMALVCVIVLLVCIPGALAWNRHVQAVHDAEVAAAFHLVAAKVAVAEELIEQKQYVAAKAALDVAEPVAREHSVLSGELEHICKLRECPEIRMGANGYVLMESLWLPPETAKSWQETRQRYDPKIAQLEEKARACQKDKKLDDGRLACEEALALMDQYPVKPHPRQAAVQEVLLTIKNEVVAAEMTAKGLVLYDNKWVTPEDKFKLEQQAKGLAEYKGQWLPKEEAFANEQTDKGLVLFNGKWMTPDEKMAADGYVQFEGKWVKPEEKQAILATRAEEAKKERARQEAERKRLAQEAQQRQPGTEAMKEIAYRQSQQFVKQILKTSASARFQSYRSNDVTVIYDQGWYSVTAIVVTQDASGAMLRKTYVCKLRPKGSNDKWEAEYTDFLD